MAGASQIKAGEAFVELSTRDTLMRAGLLRAQRSLSAFVARAKKLADFSQIGFGLNRGGQTLIEGGAALAGVAASVLGPVKAAVSTYTAVGDQFEKASLRTGVAIDKLAELEYAAGQSGVQFTVLEAALRKMQDGITEAGKGTGPASDALDTLGLSLGKLQGLSPEDQFKRIGDAINDVQDPAKRTALAMDLFGKSGVGVLPLFAQGAEGVEALTARFRELGLSIDPDDARNAVALGDAFADGQRVFKAIAFAIGSALAPKLKEMTDALLRNAARVIAWVKTNRELILTVVKIATGVGIAAIALIALGGVLKIAAAGFLGIAAGAKIAIAVVGLIVPVVSGLIGVLGLLISPVGLAVAGLAAMAGAAVYLSGAMQPLMRAWGELSAIVGETLAAIRDRLMAGDLAGAAKVAWAGLQAVWGVGIARLREAWETFKLWLLRAGVETFFGVAGWAVEGVSMIRTAWADLKAWLSKFWADTANAGSETWNLIALGAKKAANAARGAVDAEFDADAANRRAEDAFVADQKAAQAKLRSTNQSADAENAQARAKIESQRNIAQQVLGSTLIAVQAQVAENLANAQKDGDRAVAEAMAELKGQLEALKTPGPGSADSPDGGLPGAGAGAGAKGLQQSILDAIEAAQNGTDQVQARAAQSAAAVGSFDARSLGFLNRNTEAKETAANTREAVRWLKRLAESDGFTFA